MHNIYVLRWVSNAPHSQRNPGKLHGESSPGTALGGRQEFSLTGELGWEWHTGAGANRACAPGQMVGCFGRGAGASVQRREAEQMRWGHRAEVWSRRAPQSGGQGGTRGCRVL